jgi:hypothetical protein
VFEIDDSRWLEHLHSNASCGMVIFNCRDAVSFRILASMASLTSQLVQCKEEDSKARQIRYMLNSLTLVARNSHRCTHPVPEFRPLHYAHHHWLLLDSALDTTGRHKSQIRDQDWLVSYAIDSPIEDPDAFQISSTPRIGCKMVA